MTRPMPEAPPMTVHPPLRRWATRILAGLGLGLLLALPGLAQTHAYTHNGSAMVVEQSGAQVRILYATPRSGLRPEGVTEGTELFRGTLENGYLSGLALIFRSGCGRLDYYVYGDFRLGESFTLTGAAPVLARQGCAVIDNTYDGPNANLVFTAARVGAAPTPPPGPGPRLCVNGIVATSSLNLRTGPGLGYGVIGEIPANACDVIAGPAAASGWQAVRWQGRLGWASSTYLRAAP